MKYPGHPCSGLHLMIYITIISTAASSWVRHMVYTGGLLTLPFKKMCKSRNMVELGLLLVGTWKIDLFLDIYIIILLIFTSVIVYNITM